MEAEAHVNYRWQFIRNEYLLRLRIDEWENWFLIHAPKRKRSAKATENTVTCSDICSTLKTKNIYLEFDGDETGIGTLGELAAQVLKRTGWAYDEAGSDTIYEKDGETEKIRSFKTSGKNGAYKMICDLCTLFDAYPVFDSTDILTRKVRFRSMNNRGELREAMIGLDVNSIEIEENTEDLITRLYVEGEYGEDGYVGIDDVNLDMPGMTYLMNFSYYQNSGLFTEAHE